MSSSSTRAHWAWSEEELIRAERKGPEKARAAAPRHEPITHHHRRGSVAQPYNRRLSRAKEVVVGREMMSGEVGTQAGGVESMMSLELGGFSPPALACFACREAHTACSKYDTATTPFEES